MFGSLPSRRGKTGGIVVAAWRVLGLLTLRPRKGGETNDGAGLSQDSVVPRTLSNVACDELPPY